jgi:eukaryotic-like serine/threonine-protein kinase
VLTVETTEPLARPSGPRYQPIAQIGRGGMAEVLLAMMDAGCGARRLVVLKRIWPELAIDPDFMTMFLDEARLSVRMNHPNVVRTYEVLARGAEATIAMEYLDGQPLTRVMNRLRGTDELTVPLRLRILMSVLAGLEHAHTLTDLDGKSLEVVHRDVSPHNVFVTYDGQVKLVDFGVAKTLAASHHTRPGALKGKLAYMAPEQLQPVEVDRRADLFSVGVMLWEMLAGKRMWHGMNEVQIVSQLAAGLPFPPLPLDAGIPAGLDSICEQALHPNPQYRYQTAAEMEEDLERVLTGLEDSHARSLGRVVSLAFAAERAERQGLIEASSRLEVGADIPMAPPARDAEPEVTPPAAQRSHTPAQSIVVQGTPSELTPERATSGEGVQLPAAPVETMLSVEVTAASPTAERPTAERPGVERPVGADTTGTPTLAPEAPTGRHVSSHMSSAMSSAVSSAVSSQVSWRGRRVWLRRTAVVAGLMAIAALLVRFDGGAKRLVFVGHAAPAAAVALPASPTPPPPSPPATATRAVPSPRPPLHGRSSVPLDEAASARDPQPSRSRRHPHKPSPDEDATLPPTPELSGEATTDSPTEPPDSAPPNGRHTP